MTEKSEKSEKSENNYLTPSGAVVRNPLSVIAIFVALVETIATVTLLNALEKPEISIPLVWFVVLFPTLIALLFFGMLWWKHERIYSPMDFRSDKSFLGAMDKRMETVEKEISKLGPGQELNEAALSVLKAFVELPEVPAPIKEIVRSSKLDDTKVQDALDVLGDGGLVERTLNDDWRLREWGRIRLRQEFAFSDADMRLLGKISELSKDRPLTKELADHFGLSTEPTERTLQRMERFGLISASKKKRPGGWRLRSWGRDALKEAHNA